MRSSIMLRNQTDVRLIFSIESGSVEQGNGWSMVAEPFTTCPIPLHLAKERIRVTPFKERRSDDADVPYLHNVPTTR